MENNFPVGKFSFKVQKATGLFCLVQNGPARSKEGSRGCILNLYIVKDNKGAKGNTASWGARRTGAEPPCLE